MAKKIKINTMIKFKTFSYIHKTGKTVLSPDATFCECINGIFSGKVIKTWDDDVENSLIIPDENDVILMNYLYRNAKIDEKYNVFILQINVFDLI